MSQDRSFIQIANPNSNEELERAAKLINLAFKKQEVAAKNRTTLTLEELKYLTSNGRGELYLLFQNPSELIGASLLDLQEQGTEIRFVSIDPLRQKKNLGIRLMEFAEDRAANIYHRTCAYLTTIYHPQYPQKGLIAYYEKQGYRLIQDMILDEPNKKYFDEKYHGQIIIKLFRKDFKKVFY